jgi:DNA polymerase
MSWSAQQQKMLAAMGLRVWAPPPLELPESESALEARLPRSLIRRKRWTPQAPRGNRGPPLPPAAVQPHAAAAGPLAGLDWPALREVVAGCRACSLCETRTQTVFGVGHPHAHWMVIGEAPGEQEDLQGEPFVGPAGQLLDRMLAALKLTRATDGDAPPAQRVFIANTLKCRPPRNRNPTPEELQRCEPFLMRQIELVKPRIILAMGAFAVRALLRSDQPVGRLRGQVHRYHGVPLVVTYHPAYLLRSLTEKAKAWEDLCLAAQVVEEGVESSGPYAQPAPV